ncbi:universal stress protein [Phaeacidiphilus oryzae]|uniref:universal stress protein n=1 Tax=Phaeacidiphilus oryzae TaxID=348818 RepID=UPI00068CA482|nr:universal stress protein [Phaeacidiphilus oryzae]
MAGTAERQGSRRQRPGRIVVGVDGSASSQEALRWAVGQGRLAGAVVEALAAWERPLDYGGYGVALMDVDFAGPARDALDSSIAALGPEAEKDVEIVRRVVQGHPADVLLKAAQGADLLVLGSRGHGGFAGALLGSVGQHCVQHAGCPVVIVRHGEQPADAEARTRPAS